jgi:Tfp pilus assembly protein PilN
MVDLHKEIKLSDLFKRTPKDAAKRTEKPEKPLKPPKERKRRKEPKAPKVAAVTAHEAPELLAIPLMRAFNLLPSEVAREAKERQGHLPHVLVALGGVLVVAALAAFYLMAGAEVTKKRGEAEDLRAQLATYEAQAEQPAVDEKTSALAAERIARTNALSVTVGTRLAWDRLLRELAFVIPEDATMARIEATAPAAYNAPPPPVDGSPVVNFTITGGIDSQASVAEFLARLSAIPELTNVTIKESRRAEASDAEARGRPYLFAITATLRAGP